MHAREREWVFLLCCWIQRGQASVVGSGWREAHTTGRQAQREWFWARRAARGCGFWATRRTPASGAGGACVGALFNSISSSWAPSLTAYQTGRQQSDLHARQGRHFSFSRKKGAGGQPAHQEKGRHLASQRALHETKRGRQAGSQGQALRKQSSTARGARRG